MGNILTNVYDYVYPNRKKLLFEYSNNFNKLKNDYSIDSQARMHRSTVKQQQRRFLHKN